VKRFQRWHLFERLSLTENVRCRDPEFRRFLLSVGNGELVQPDPDGNDFDGSKIFPVPRELIEPRGLEGLIDFVFDDATLRDPNRLAKSAILAPRNAEVNQINEVVLNRLVNTHGRIVPE